MPPKTNQSQVETVRDLFAQIPDAGSRNPQTPPIPYYGALIPSNSVFFCRLTRSDIYRKRNRMHVGDRYVLARVFETSGDIKVNGVSYHLKPGDAFLICPQQMHAYENIAEERVTWLFWAFNVENNPGLNALGQRKLKVTDAIDDMLQSLAATYLETKPSMIAESNALNLKCSILLEQIVTHNALSAEVREASSNEVDYTDHLLQAINDYISENLNERITLSELAKAVGYSESHLRRLFKQRVNISLGKYIRELRLKRSITMVIATDQSMTEIAYDCGYNSLSTFYRMFHETVGCAPKDFRRKYRSKEITNEEIQSLSSLSFG